MLDADCTFELPKVKAERKTLTTMLIGSGLLAQSFAPSFSHREDVCIYAAGVSNSTCSDTREFDRERQRLCGALDYAHNLDVFVYFGTCSVHDPEAQGTPYVQHKLAMEGLASTHPCHLILRLPQVAGRTPNPHTLLNFLYACVSRSEAFPLWRKATRNIIDVADVVAIAECLIADKARWSGPLNIANTLSYTMAEIVYAMEQAVGKRAVFHSVERGSDYSIDTDSIVPILQKTSAKFGDGYLERVVKKYYGKTD